MISTALRAYQPEIMDGSDFSAEEYERTLLQLERINRLTNGYKPTIEAVARLAMGMSRPLRVLDIGYGHGDTLRALARWSRESGVELDLRGIDLNPSARVHAERATPASDGIRYLTGNVFEYAGEPFDVALNSLFMHHLGDEEIVRVLKWMTTNAERGWFINDLHRHPVAYHFIKVATRIAGCTPMICNDAPLSVARSFRRRDWVSYLAAAGVVGAEIRWHIPFRYGVFYSKSRSTEAAR